MIETGRLLMRQWTIDDLEEMSAVVAANVEHLRPWMPWVAAEPLSRSERIALIEGWQREWSDGGALVVGVFLDGAPIGGTGYHVNRGPTTLEIGYWIDVRHVRQGYATELSAALTSEAFTVEGIDRVEIHHDRANVASRGVPRLLGFTLEAESPDEATSPGEMGIDCCWVMTPERWVSR